MKSLFVVVLSIVVGVSFTACGGSTKSKPKPVVKKEKKVVKKPVKKVDNSILAYAKDKEVFEIDTVTIKKLLASKKFKKKSLESKVVDLIETTMINKSFTIKDIYTNYANIKEVKDSFAVVGVVNSVINDYHFGYIALYNKVSLKIEKLHIFKDAGVLDVSSDMENILVNNFTRIYPKSGDSFNSNKIKKYSFKVNKFVDILISYYDIEYAHFSPLEKYIVINQKGKIDNERFAYFHVYDNKTNKELLVEKRHHNRSQIYNYSFTPNDKYFVLNYIAVRKKETTLTLYNTSTFKKIKELESKKNLDFDTFVLSDKYLIIASGENKLYNIESKEVRDIKVGHYNSPLLADKTDNNLFYGFSDDKCHIYYIKDDKFYFIKEIGKVEAFVKEAFIIDNKLYIFPKFDDGKFDIVDIPRKEIENYDFELVKQLKQAKKFYKVGFKDKAMKEYKKALKNKDFDKYFKSVNISVNAFIDLEKYKSTKDIKYLESYILKALKAKYLKEAKTALNALNRSANKNAERYLILHSAYLAEIGKADKAYKALVEVMPFSKESVDMVKKYSRFSIKLYKESDKIALIFDIKKSSIFYKEADKYDEFISFDGRLISKNKSSASKSKKKVSKKSEAVELLD